MRAFSGKSEGDSAGRDAPSSLLEPTAPLLLRAWRAKVWTTLIILAYYLAGYFTLNRFPFGTYHEVPAVPWLDELPFLVWTIWTSPPARRWGCWEQLLSRA